MKTFQEQVVASTEAQLIATADLTQAALGGIESLFMLQMSSLRALLLASSPATVIIACADAAGGEASPPAAQP